MAILDQWGNPVSENKFAQGASRNPHLGSLFSPANRGVDELIPQRDRKTLAAVSRQLVFNQGPAKEAIRQKASYSVGAAWLPIYSGSDTEAGEDATSWLRNVWYPVCDSRGSGADWHEFLEMVSKAMDRDGEAFVLLTENDKEFPQIKQIPAHMVGSKPEVKQVKSGPYRGLKIQDGVITNGRGRSVAYRVNKDPQGNTFEDISARDLIHVFDADYAEQRRGFPAFSHALNDLKNSLTSQQLETIRQNIISSIYLLEKTDHGPDPEDPAWTPSIDTTNNEAILTEQVSPGIRHLRSSGEELEVVKHENPGDIWESFQDRLIRSAVVGMGWAYALVWKSPGQGTAERAEVVRARKAVESRQKKLRFVAKRAITYALAKADQNPGLTVSAPGNMLKWSFSMPERLSVDDGREARSMKDAVEAGLCSETEYQSFRGKSYEQHCWEQAQDRITRARVAREATENNSEGVTVTPEELGAHETQPAPVMEPATQ